MKGRTTGKNVRDAVMCILNKFNLQLTKLCGLTTDGAPSMIGKNTGFTIILKKTVAHEIIVRHCILHQEQLCAKTLNMKHVMKNVISTVNFIKSNGLNHRQFRAFLEDIDSNYDDIVY